MTMEMVIMVMEVTMIPVVVTMVTMVVTLMRELTIREGVCPAARKLWRRQLDLKTLYVTNEPYHKIRLVALMYDSSLPQSP